MTQKWNFWHLSWMCQQSSEYLQYHGQKNNNFETDQFAYGGQEMHLTAVFKSELWYLRCRLKQSLPKAQRPIQSRWKPYQQSKKDFADNPAQNHKGIMYGIDE